MSDDEFSGAKQKGKKPARVLKKDKYEALIIVIDCGPHMKKKETNGSTSFDCAKEAVDWILSRKIFTQSKDRINMILVGAESTRNDQNAANILVKDDELTAVGFDHLKFLQTEVQMTKENGSVVDALHVAVAAFRTADETAVESKSILLITNGESTSEGADKIKSLANDMNQKEINLITMGINSDTPSAAVKELIEKVDGSSMSFDDASSTLHNFTQKKVAGRAMKKNWEIGPGLSLPLTFHMRSTPAKNPIKAMTVNEKGEEVKREIQYFTKYKRMEDDFIDEDNGMSAEAEQLEKADLAYGYLFGKSKVVLTEDDMAEYKGHNFNEGEKGGCLKLLQFTKKNNVPPSFFIGNNSHFVVPFVDKKTISRDEQLMRVTLAIIEGMLEQDVVAICRYAYHASSNLQLMALIPRRENNQLYMTAIRLPFMDDWRPFSLPDISLRGPQPSADQTIAIDELIDAMNLSKSDVSYENVLNPFFQRQCTMMKMKALKNMNCLDKINVEPSVFLKRGLEPEQNLIETKEFQKIANSLLEVFNLEEVIRVKRKRRDYTAQNKDYLMGYDEADEEEEETIKEEIVPIGMPDHDGPHKKFWDKVRKALEGGGTAINSWTNNVAIDMSLFDESNLAAVEKFKILRAEMLAANRIVDFNQWLMSLHGNDDYSDFFQFMDSRNEPALITLEESPDSWYTTVESQMYWSGMLDEEKKK